MGKLNATFCVFLIVAVSTVLSANNRNNKIELDMFSRPFYEKVENRLNTAALTPEQKENAKEILRKTKENLYQCEQSYKPDLENNTNFRACAGRSIGLAMSQFGYLEMISRPNFRENKRNNHHE
ncbi:uncharacterized protein LOC129614392 [Condylostylus longicornis]|uniref:uncharacterized protein LOC129614392 n=1 Tax=Condylostylus longicornis TaxID=2530218 RepID=UPI00244DC804|nr:uncharacterized protein LOC129614392 [Condylostylus longicornis]